jgi:hypothetical protein
LGDYILELVGRLAQSEPAAFAQLRATVDGREARITLDGETVAVVFRGDHLYVEEPTEGRSDGDGATDGTCVADLLEGYSGVSEALLDGRLRASGQPEDVAAMFAAIEILLDASARSPPLQALARDFLGDPCRPARRARLPGDVTPGAQWSPGTTTDLEMAVLARLDLLPDDLAG